MQFLNPMHLIVSGGLLAVYLIIFAESGLLIGFFLPGDSLLFTAGLLASQGYFSIWYLILGGIVAAILGDNLGYYLGKKYGSRIFNKEESLFFHKDHIEKAKSFYKRYGAITVVLARFVPLIRAFAPVLAGVGDMPYSKFFSYNIIGGIIWIIVMSYLGYIIGAKVPNIDHYILPIVGVAVIGSIVVPGLMQLFRKKRA